MRYGPYEIVGELGRGGMGVVHRARHVELGHEVALKVIAPNPTMPDLLARARREANAAARLADHPGLVAVHDVGEADGRLWLAMRLVEGRSLEKIVDDGDVSAADAARWVAAAVPERCTTPTALGCCTATSSPPTS